MAEKIRLVQLVAMSELSIDGKHVVWSLLYGLDGDGQAWRFDGQYWVRVSMERAP